MDGFSDFLTLFVFALLWTFTYWYSSLKYGRWSIGATMVLLYTLISWTLFYIYFSPQRHNYFKEGLTLFPFIYLFILLFMGISPLFNYSTKFIERISIPKPKYFNIVCVLFSTFSIISLIKIIPSLREGLVGIILDNSVVADIYSKSTYSRMNQSNVGGFDIISILGNMANAIIPFLFFCYLLVKKRNRIIMLMLGVCIFITPLQGIANASRLNIATSFIMFILLGVFFLPLLSLKIRTNLKKGAIITASFFAIVFILITVGRSGSNSSNPILYNFSRYLAEGPIVFNNYCMNAGGTREGEYTFAFKHILERKQQLNETELRDKFSNLKIDSSRFYTYVGDFVLDYGPINTVIILGFVYLFFSLKSRIQNKTIQFNQLVLLYIILQFCSGFYQYQFSMKAGNANLLILIILYFTSLFFKKISPRYFEIYHLH